MSARDTTPDAAAIRAHVYRRMSGEQRANIGAQMSEDARAIRGVPVEAATAEDTIVAKLEWSKAGSFERQLEDVAGILRVRGSDLDLDYILRRIDELELREQWDRARAR